jgi:hypothetical protein
MTLRYSIQKIEAALRLLGEFESASFPHADSTNAIQDLRQLLVETRKELASNVSSALGRQTEMQATSLIAEILELLGVISNSANVRNSFEIHGPVRDLVSRLLLDKNANFIISFEWDYIPYTYPQTHPCLPSFVIIGLPASEASNALVLPVIGHELGHSLWRKENFRPQFEAGVTQAIIDSIKGKFKSRYENLFNIKADKCDDYDYIDTWGDAAEYAFRQVEELFSDFTGLYIFGESYLDSFEYLLSPALSQERVPEYPSTTLRAEYLQTYASKLGVSAPLDFSNRFEQELSPFRPNSKNRLQMDLADEASSILLPDIVDSVLDTCKNRGVLPPSKMETDGILEKFLLGVPAEQTSGLGVILNAGWIAFKSEAFMELASDSVRMAAINELVLKSVEVFEIERMTTRGSKTKRPQASA